MAHHVANVGHCMCTVLTSLLSDIQVLSLLYRYITGETFQTVWYPGGHVDCPWCVVSHPHGNSCPAVVTTLFLILCCFPTRQCHSIFKYIYNNDRFLFNMENIEGNSNIGSTFSVGCQPNVISTTKQGGVTDYERLRQVCNQFYHHTRTV